MTKLEKLELEIKEKIEKLILDILKDFDLSNYKIEIKVFITGCLIDIQLNHFFNLYIHYTDYPTNIRFDRLNIDIVNDTECRMPYVTGTTINDYITKSCSLNEYIEFLMPKSSYIISRCMVKLVTLVCQMVIYISI